MSRISRFLVSWLLIAFSVGFAAWILPGITIDESQNGVLVVIGMALILGLVNAIIKPILTLLSCGCIAATLGLFIFVINALTFWFASWLSQQLGLGFYVESFWAALAGSIIVSVVSIVLGWFFIDEDK